MPIFLQAAPRKSSTVSISYRQNWGFEHRIPPARPKDDVGLAVQRECSAQLKEKPRRSGTSCHGNVRYTPERSVSVSLDAALQRKPLQQRELRDNKNKGQAHQAEYLEVNP